MHPGKPLFPGNAKEEVSALIETLHQTDERLEELTAGEVDAVVDHRGRTSLLRRASDHLHCREAAILNTLPANIAALDTQGCIILVNEAWRQSSGTNALHSPGYGIGVNYLEICDGARGDDAFEAQRVAAGIRSVLYGAAKNFSMEYPCRSPTAQRWFLMKVTPLAGTLRRQAWWARPGVPLREGDGGGHRPECFGEFRRVGVTCACAWRFRATRPV